MANKSLTAAKKAKNDEFYTQLSDIEKELRHYKHHFSGKVVFCNCDDPTYSEFWRYFHLNFSELGLKKLVATHYDPDSSSYGIEYEGGNDADYTVGTVFRLKQHGDFRSDECIELLKQSDIVVTNPPFSLFRLYVEQLMKYGKKFIIIGNKNAITYKEFFPLLKDNKVWIGCNNVKEFCQSDGSVKKFGNIGWYTNLDVVKQHEDLVLWQRYYEDDGVTPKPDAEKRYPHYDNYDAINVDRLQDIPCDYFGVMGVPITFLDKYNPSGLTSRLFRQIDRQTCLEMLQDGLKFSELSITEQMENGICANVLSMVKKNLSGLPLNGDLAENFVVLGYTGGIGWDDNNDVKTIITYKDCKQHNPDGSISNGSKLNTGAVLKYDVKPCGRYYSTSSKSGYFERLYGRILIQRRVERKNRL